LLRLLLLLLLLLAPLVDGIVTVAR